MTTHSIDGYLALLHLREHRTVLVEGGTDRKVVQRLLVELEGLGRMGAARVVVDTADGIHASGLDRGARVIVESVHAQCVGLRRRMAALVDREFRRFRLDQPIQDEHPDHVVVDESLFWTRGHSIENYLFTSEATLAYLTMQYPHLISDVTRRLVVEGTTRLLLWATSLSIAGARASLLQRLVGTVDFESWKLDGEGLPVLQTATVCADLASRGVVRDVVDRFAVDVEKVYEDVSRSVGVEVLRWIAHGHVGTQVLWSGLGAVLAAHGASTLECEQIGSGNRDVKLRLGADQWVKRHCPAAAEALGTEFPMALMKWLCEPDVNKAA